MQERASAGEGSMPALLWWRATLRGAGSVIYLEIGFSNSAAATAMTAVTACGKPCDKPHTWASWRAVVRAAHWVLAMAQGFVVCGKGGVYTAFQQYIFRCKIWNLIFDFLRQGLVWYSLSWSWTHDPSSSASWVLWLQEGPPNLKSLNLKSTGHQYTWYEQNIIFPRKPIGWQHRSHRRQEGELQRLPPSSPGHLPIIWYGPPSHQLCSGRASPDSGWMFWQSM